jgi:putative transposase
VNHVWGYDFVFGTCADGRTLKCLTVIEEFTREWLAIDVAGGIRSGRVIEVLAQLVSVRGAPQFLRSDNGPEFVATRSCAGCTRRRLKPPSSILVSRADAKVSIEAWRRHYNEVRPHASLAYLTPAAFKAKHLADVAGGHSPAMPARADVTKNGELRTGPISAILQ